MNLFCPTKTRDEIINDPQLLSFCGCHAPPDPLLNGIDPQCDPLCNQLGTVPLQDPLTGLKLECNTTVCVINDVNLGSISQICSGCSESQPCKCIISNIPEGLDVSMCGSDSVCLEPNESGVLIPVDCGPMVTQETTFSVSPVIISIAIMLIIVMILFIIFYPVFKKKKKD